MFAGEVGEVSWTGSGKRAPEFPDRLELSHSVIAINAHVSSVELLLLSNQLLKVTHLREEAHFISHGYGQAPQVKFKPDKACVHCVLMYRNTPHGKLLT